MIPPPRAESLGARWLLAAALCLVPAPAAAQSVVELEAGGTSLYDSYGVAAHLYTARADGWIGVGVYFAASKSASARPGWTVPAVPAGWGFLFKRLLFIEVYFGFQFWSADTTAMPLLVAVI